MFSRDASPIYFYEKGGMVNLPFCRQCAENLWDPGQLHQPGGFLNGSPRHLSGSTVPTYWAPGNDSDLKGVIVFWLLTHRCI